MQFASFKHNNETYAGIYHNGGYYTFASLLKQDAPETVLKYIAEYENKAEPDFQSIISEYGLKPLMPDEINLTAPIPYPRRNVICLGRNYLDHANEIAGTVTSVSGGVPEAPVYFAKNAFPALGNAEPVPLHGGFTKQVDYEAELAVIIGKTAYNIPPNEVENVIFGYTVLNDITARDVQNTYGQWYFGKSLDGFCVLGPHIVTKDEIPFPVKLDISCRVNGETRQSSNTSLLIYGIERVISELSQGMRLYPGDIIATGTPGGVGHAMNPPRYLRAGDIVECEIEKIGVLTSVFHDV